jgi:hypothetical protein
MSLCRYPLECMNSILVICHNHIQKKSCYSHSSQLTHAKRIKSELVLRHIVRDAANKKIYEIKCYVVQYLCKNDGSFHFHAIDKKILYSVR